MPEKIRFTATSLAALQPPANRYIAWDQKHSGLGMRVSPQDTRTAVFLYRFNGKARFLTLGNFPARTVEQILEDYYVAARDVSKAQHMLRHELRTPPKELDPAKRKSEAHEARRAAGTVRELWGAYRTAKLEGKVRDTTLYEHDRMWKTYILPELGETHADDVSKRMEEALRERKRALALKRLARLA